MTWAGLPIETWIFMVVATVPGLVLVVRAYGLHRRARKQGTGGSGEEPPGYGHRRD